MSMYVCLFVCMFVILNLFCFKRERGQSKKRAKHEANTYEGDSNENLKSAIKIRNAAQLSRKLTIMILMV
jgi:Na+/melibiose symporter-like transporter